MVDAKRILIVDDDRAVLFVFEEALQQFGDTHKIVTAQNGVEALDKFKEQPFDLVITDLKMPGMDGVGLTEAIRALDSETPVIWITAHGSFRFGADAQRLGVLCCRDKPLEIQEILDVAENALNACRKPT